MNGRPNTRLQSPQGATFLLMRTFNIYSHYLPLDPPICPVSYRGRKDLRTCNARDGTKVKVSKVGGPVG